jgi:hypothetical protein
VAQYIQEERAQRKAQRQSFSLHRYIHHGLSSQTVLFNLVGPLIVSRDLEPLRQAFAQRGIAWPEGELSASFDCAEPHGRRGLMPFLLSLLLESVHDRVATVSIQQVVAAIRSSGRHEWIAEFERKYGLM